MKLTSMLKPKATQEPTTMQTRPTVEERVDQLARAKSASESANDVAVEAQAAFFASGTEEDRKEFQLARARAEDAALDVERAEHLLTQARAERETEVRRAKRQQAADFRHRAQAKSAERTAAAERVAQALVVAADAHAAAVAADIEMDGYIVQALRLEMEVGDADDGAMARHNRDSRPGQGIGAFVRVAYVALPAGADARRPGSNISALLEAACRT